MKSFTLLIAVLGGLKAEPRTIAQLATDIGVGYISAMKAVNGLRFAGLVHRVGEVRRRPDRGEAAAIYAFRGGQAVVVGRIATCKFLRLWNALQTPTSVADALTSAGFGDSHARVTIHAMRKAGLVYRAGWACDSGKAYMPSCLYAVGDKRDAARPRRVPVTELNRRSTVAKRMKQLVRLAANDPWTVMRDQLRRAA